MSLLVVYFPLNRFFSDYSSVRKGQRRAVELEYGHPLSSNTHSAQCSGQFSIKVLNQIQSLSLRHSFECWTFPDT